MRLASPGFPLVARNRDSADGSGARYRLYHAWTHRLLRTGIGVACHEPAVRDTISMIFTLPSRLVLQSSLWERHGALTRGRARGRRGALSVAFAPLPRAP